MAAMQAETLKHPAPYRRKVNRWRLLIALAGAPASWVALTNISYIAASNACYPHRAPLPAPLWEGMDSWLGVFNVLCLITGGLSGLLAFTMWQSTRRKTAGEEKHAVDAGEGRARFLAMLGMMSSGLFTAAILFTACANLLISPCRPWLQP